MKLFTVYDSKAEAYLVPFYERTTGLAIRAFSSASNEKEHQFNRFPADYTLFELGEFDELTAEIKVLKTPTSLGLAINFLEQPELPGTPVPLQLASQLGKPGDIAGGE